MIEQLEIKNFQSHKSSLLNFHPGVNTIIGTSDHGKSAVFRALNFVFKNKPDGTAFISHWCKNDKGNYTDNTEVSVKVDGHEIKRVKGKENEYYLDGEKLTAFNRDVPESVAELLNMDDINIQHQANNFFLLDMSSGKVAEEFNRLVNLDVIDISLSNVNGLLRKTKSEIDVTEKEIVKHTEALESFGFLESMEKDVDKFIVLQETIDKQNIRHDRLADILDAIDGCSIKIGAVSKILPAEKELKKLEILKDSKGKLENSIDTLMLMIESTNKTEENLKDLSEFVKAEKAINSLLKKMQDIEKLESIIADLAINLKAIEVCDESLKKFDKLPPMKLVDKLIKLDVERVEKTKLFNYLDTTIEYYMTAKNNWQIADNKLKEWIQEYTDAVGDVCPVCGKELSEEDKCNIF